MKRIAYLTVALFFLITPVGAQEMHPHGHDRAEKLGQVNFDVSCTPQAQKQFNHAVAWLHSFEYEEAEKAFTEVTVIDPQCGMGYWGVAMSNYHPLWAPPTAPKAAPPVPPGTPRVVPDGGRSLRRRRRHLRVRRRRGHPQPQPGGD